MLMVNGSVLTIDIYIYREREKERVLKDLHAY